MTIDPLYCCDPVYPGTVANPTAEPPLTLPTIMSTLDRLFGRAPPEPTPTIWDEPLFHWDAAFATMNVPVGLMVQIHHEPIGIGRLRHAAWKRLGPDFARRPFRAAAHERLNCLEAL